MNERLRQAIEDIVSVAQEANSLSREDQEELATRLEIMAKELSWQQCFYSPVPLLDTMIDEAAAPDADGDAYTVP